MDNATPKLKPEDYPHYEASKERATPRPWYTDGNKIYSLDHQPICEIRDNSYSKSNEPKRLASLIVTSVNCHDSIVEALKEIINIALSIDSFKTTLVVGKAKQALAQMEKYDTNTR